MLKSKKLTPFSLLQSSELPTFVKKNIYVTAPKRRPPKVLPGQQFDVVNAERQNVTLLCERVAFKHVCWIISRNQERAQHGQLGKF